MSVDLPSSTLPQVRIRSSVFCCSVSRNVSIESCSGKTVADIQVETYTQVIILAIRKTHGQMTFNPPSEFKVEGGDHLIAVGERDGLKKLAQMLAPKTGA